MKHRVYSRVLARWSVRQKVNHVSLVQFSCVRVLT